MDSKALGKLFLGFSLILLTSVTYSIEIDNINESQEMELIEGDSENIYLIRNSQEIDYIEDQDSYFHIKSFKTNFSENQQITLIINRDSTIFENWDFEERSVGLYTGENLQRTSSRLNPDAFKVNKTSKAENYHIVGVDGERTEYKDQYGTCDVYLRPIEKEKCTLLDDFDFLWPLTVISILLAAIIVKLILIPLYRKKRLMSKISSKTEVIKNIDDVDERNRKLKRVLEIEKMAYNDEIKKALRKLNQLETGN